MELAAAIGFHHLLTHTYRWSCEIEFSEVRFSHSVLHSPKNMQPTGERGRYALTTATAIDMSDLLSSTLSKTNLVNNPGS